MAWLSQLGVFVGTVAVLFVPGLVVGLSVGARRFLLIALAAPLTITVIGAAALANQAIPFRWGILPLIIATLVIAGLTWAARWLFRRRWVHVPPSAPSRARTIALVAGLGAAFVLIGGRLVLSIGDPTNISQTFDNIYHLNAVRYIEHTGNISPFQQLLPGFYPDLWHALVVAVIAVTGTTIPIAVNMVSIAIAGLMWPLGCVFLTRQIVGPRPVALALAGVASAAFAAFPMLLLDFGVLYPNVLGEAMVPATFAIVVMVTGRRQDRPISMAAGIWLLICLVPAVALAHPNALMALIVLSFAPCLVTVFQLARRLLRSEASWRRWAVCMGAWAVGGLIAAAVLLKARPTYAQAFWGPSNSFSGSVIAVMLNSPVGRPIAVTVSVLMLLGIVACFVRRRHRWVVAAFAIMGGIYVICASFPRAGFRYWITGSWYSDINRIAAVMPIIAIPLVVIGGVWIVDLVLQAIDRLGSARARRSMGRYAAIASAALMLLVVAASQLEPTLQIATASAENSYRSDANSPLLTPDERKLLDKLPSEVPKDAVIAGSPWTGTSLSYAISDRQALVPHIYSAITPRMEDVIQHLRDARRHPSVCRAIRAERVKYVLDFGLTEVHGERHPFPGLEKLSNSNAVTLIDHVGPAKLYKVTACWS